MPPALEAAEAGGVLDQRAALFGPRGEDLLDAALPDDRARVGAEAEVGEQLDEVEPPHRGAVHQVLTLAAAVQPPHDRELREVERPLGVLVVEHQLDLARGSGRPGSGAAEQHVVGLLGAQLARREAARGPDDRVSEVRLAGAVRPDHDRDPRLEPKLDRLRERLEATQAKRAQVHERKLSTAADAARLRSSLDRGRERASSSRPRVLPYGGKTRSPFPRAATRLPSAARTAMAR